ncbi:hypothetical protein MTO96_012992 [Rhipicephalus appendiculatus]
MSSSLIGMRERSAARPAQGRARIWKASGGPADDEDLRVFISRLRDYEHASATRENKRLAGFFWRNLSGTLSQTAEATDRPSVQHP